MLLQTKIEGIQCPQVVFIIGILAKSLPEFVELAYR